MSEATVPARVSDAIAAYRMRGIFIDDSDGAELEGELEALRVPGNAEGLCCAVSEDFARFCREQFDLDAFLNPAPRQVYDAIHDVTFIVEGEQTLAVDWTAAQFEWTESFPVVLRLYGHHWKDVSPESE